MRNKRLVHFPIHIGNYKSFLDEIETLAADAKSSYVCVGNVHMFVEAYQKADFLNVIKTADCVTPDGVPLTWALRLLYGIKQDRVAGMDLLPDLLSIAEQKHLTVFFYGGTQN